jgi:hypothetical protein
MMTRDWNGWWWVMIGGIATNLLSDLPTVDVLLPDAWEPMVHAVIKLVSISVTAGAGVARMSPISISAEGRRKAIHRDTGHLPKASVAAAVANVAAAKAADVTKDAAKKAEVAEDLAKPGAA